MYEVMSLCTFNLVEWTFIFTNLWSYSKKTPFIMQELIFSTEFRTFYDLRVRAMLIRLFLALFSPFSAVLGTSIHPFPISDCRKMIFSRKTSFSCVYNASMCYLSDLSGSSLVFAFKLWACTVKVENLNSYLHFSRFFWPVVYFLSSVWF